METSEYEGEWKRIAGSTQVLLRSRIEIDSVLQSLIDDDLPLVSHHQVHDQLFIAKLHRVCAEQNFIVVGYSDKIANAEIFAAGTVLFAPTQGLCQFGKQPGRTGRSGATIRSTFRNLFIEQRRVGKRIRVAAGTKLSCLADGGGITPFEARIVDVSLSGVGVMVYDPAIKLQPGTVLAGCRIDLPDGSVTSVDMQVMLSTGVVLLDGSAVCRAGCRFIGDPDRIDKVLKVFIIDLERHDKASGDRDQPR
jgi:c-di-GMP-binding flagellar brake protein YcgR